MLDVQFIRDNPELVKEKSKQKNVEVDINQLLELDSKLRQLKGQINDKREQRNKLVANWTQKPSQEEIETGAKLKNELSELEKQLEPIESEFDSLIRKVPNMPCDDVPVGATEAENKIVKTWGEKTTFEFAPKTHWELGEERDLIDKTRAVKISGSRFLYLKGGLVEMQFAIMQFVFKELTNQEVIAKLVHDNGLNITDKPFLPILPPMMMKTAPYEATGRLKAEEVTYKLADDDLWLTASAEHALCSMYMDEVIERSELPIRYIGYNTAFRREAGTYGKDTNGLVRLHHFDKMEMEVFSTAETSKDEHLLLVAIQEHLIQALGLPYNLLLKCTADIGDPNARGVDVDIWMPGQDVYKETHTADYMTDYQARDLKTRERGENGVINFVHTNDATAFAMGRILAAIMENYQTKDGKITVPTILRPFMAGKEEI